MELIDRLLKANAEHVASHGPGGLDARPSSQVAVVTCMDARIDTFAALGLTLGEAHIIRNAGGVVTDDIERSLAVSQRALGTTQIVLIHHTRCGMLTVSEDAFREEMLAETGMKPTWAVQAFTDLQADLRSSVQRVRSSVFIPHRDRVYGFIYDVDTGALQAVEAPEGVTLPG